MRCVTACCHTALYSRIQCLVLLCALVLTTPVDEPRLRECKPSAISVILKHVKQSTRRLCKECSEREWKHMYSPTLASHRGRYALPAHADGFRLDWGLLRTETQVETVLLRVLLRVLGRAVSQSVCWPRLICSSVACWRLHQASGMRGQPKDLPGTYADSWLREPPSGGASSDSAAGRPSFPRPRCLDLHTRHDQDVKWPAVYPCCCLRLLRPLPLTVPRRFCASLTGRGLPLPGILSLAGRLSLKRRCPSFLASWPCKLCVSARAGLACEGGYPGDLPAGGSCTAPSGTYQAAGARHHLLLPFFLAFALHLGCALADFGLWSHSDTHCTAFPVSLRCASQVGDRARLAFLALASAPKMCL